jgi:O-antigen/teichoic acid export membrane protein
MAALRGLSPARRAAGWTFAAFGASQVLRLGGNILLSRLLWPEAFGLSALASTILVGLNMFSDLGLVASLVRSPRGEDPEFRNTAWTLGILRGLVVWAVAAAIAVPVGRFYDERLTALLPVLGATDFLAAIGSSAVAVLNRRLQLGRVTALEFGATTAGLLVTCGWAWVSPTVWALVGGTLFGVVLKSAVSHFLLPGHRDRLRLEPRSVREITGFGRWIFLSTVVTFLSLQLDRLMLGRLLSLDQVGTYWG